MLKIILFITLLSYSFLSANNELKDYEPRGSFSKKINIGYYQGGDYTNYPVLLKSVVRNLANYGWMDPISLENLNSSKEIWDKLQSEAKSDYIAFKKDAFYNLKWDSTKREKISNEFISRLNTKKDIDLVFALGTWAGQDLSNDKHSVPTFVMSVSNPISAGILESSVSSKYKQIHARVDEKRYKRQITLFYKIIRFKKLGVVYEDSVQGKSYASIKDIESVASKKGFEIIKCAVKSDKNTLRNDIINCYKKLSKKTDAIYITTHPSYKAQDLEDFISKINTNKIPTFSQVGQSHVNYGALMSISRANFKYLSEFHAQAIGKSLNGAVPSKLGFVFEEPSKLAINIKTATLIDWDIPLDVISIADEIYQKIRTKNSLDYEE